MREISRQAMIVTPEGSIIAIGDPSQERKPETDPDWEERKAKFDAERRAGNPSAKRARKQL